MVTSGSAIHKSSNLASRSCSTIFGAGLPFSGQEMKTSNHWRDYCYRLLLCSEGRSSLMVRPRKRGAGTNSREVLPPSHGARELLEPLRNEEEEE